ncbi:septation ring formation regulator EzrA [Virgibacillus xinjiangensis]|uniref:Septation ring formation regulator EzrA n=1 Tax=Virgibacillus xinjiangensis TaxID=393090 RepID=A0ABV7CVE6_9BACI
MAYVIGIILAIILLIIVGLIIRKRVYDEVDKYEAWKMDIMDRNIAAHLSRIKSLNLSGETQEKFEDWKERWDTIASKELPDIEEHLFDAEEAADRYLFAKSKRILGDVEEILQSIEKRIEIILAEVDQLVNSEKSSRTGVEKIQPQVKALRKQVSQNRYQYGKAELHFDREIDKLEDMLEEYEVLIDGGNYLEAKAFVDQLEERVEELQQQIESFPPLYKKSKQELPAQLDNLMEGLNEMKEAGYHVSHFGFKTEILTYQEKLANNVSKLENAEMEGASETVAEVEAAITEMYDQLEKEAVAKNYLEKEMPEYENTLNELTITFSETKEDLQELREAYQLEDGDMEKYLSIESTISSLRDQLVDMAEDLENEDAAHSEVRQKVEEGFREVEELQEKHEEFKKRIQNLRKDELEAKEKLMEIRTQLQGVGRKLKKSNIPGVPTFIWNLLDEASSKNERVLEALERQPLDMVKVQEALNDSKEAVDKAMEQTEMMLEQAYLTEQVIQYANRYRSQDAVLAGKLAEAERLFRSYEYELALEQAAKAVEEIEPGALKRIEEFQMVSSGS